MSRFIRERISIGQSVSTENEDVSEEIQFRENSSSGNLNKKTEM